MFIEQLNADSSDRLIARKEELKDQVVDSKLSWQERLQLYNQIRLINEQLAQLQME